MNLVVPFVCLRAFYLFHPRLRLLIDEIRVDLSNLWVLPAMIRVALIEPEIPPNTGNVARLCAANNIPLHIVGVTGFRMDDKAVRRAGLDYWPEVILRRHPNLENLHDSLPEARFLYLTTKAEKSYADWLYGPDDCIVFGRETRGLPEYVLAANWDRCLTIPMLNPKVRSLNLATAVGIVLYEVLRQSGAIGMSRE